MPGTFVTFSRQCFKQEFIVSCFIYQRCGFSSLIVQRRNLSIDSSDEYSSEQESDEPKDDSYQHGQLYEGHIPTTSFQKALLGFGSAFAVLRDPWRDDMLAACGETTGYCALKMCKKKMTEDPTGRQILQEEPKINSRTISLDYLRQLPDETFGKHYSNFLGTHYTPDARLSVRFVDDLDLVYVMLRYRQIHDFVHTLLGCPTNMQGEVAVKWVEALQTGLPMCALGALFGPLRFGPKQRRRYLQTYLWWALQNGYYAKFLMNVYFEKHWEEPIENMRTRLNITPPPGGTVR